MSNVKSDGEHYARSIAHQNATIEKLEKQLTDRKNLTKDIIDETSKIINENKKERLEYHKNKLFDYIKTLKQLNNAENTYGREIGNLNNTANDEAIRTKELINRIEYLEDVENESLQIIDELYNDLEELRDKKNLKYDNNELRKSIDLIKNNNEYLIKEKDMLYLK